MRGLKSTKEKLFDILLALIMLGLIVVFAYPMWDTLMLSLSSTKDATKMGFRWLPSWPLNFEAYKKVFGDPQLIRAFVNTVYRTVVGTFLATFVTFGCGYALSKRDLPGNKFVTAFLLASMFVSPGLIPSYLWIKKLGLCNTYTVLIIRGIVSTTAILICRNFMSSHPREILEAAEVDGAGVFRTMFQVVLPMSKPIIAYNVLTNALGHWNSWYDAYLYNTDKKLMVLPLLLRRVLIENDGRFMDDSLLRSTALSTPETVKAATIIVTVAPILLVYPWLQKYFVQGVYLGSVKG